MVIHGTGSAILATVTAEHPLHGDNTDEKYGIQCSLSLSLLFGLHDSSKLHAILNYLLPYAM